MKSSEFIIESSQWELLNATHDKAAWSDELIYLVHNAYKNTNIGSFVNSLKDVERSDWLVLDWDDCNHPDCAIFYRKDRPNESWSGYKIQGIGHDNLPESKKRVVDRVKQQLTKNGWWIESSDAMAKTLSNIGLLAVKDKQLIQAIFPNAQLVDNNGKYKRKLSNGSIIQEIIYGKPIIKS